MNACYSQLAVSSQVPPYYCIVNIMLPVPNTSNKKLAF